jgi:hypothetical protein
LKEKKPPINALSANILALITKSWQRIIDSPHRNLTPQPP